MLRRLIAALLLIASIPLIGIGEAARSGNQPTRVKVFLVAVDDNGKSGKKIGCNDSLVAVERDVTSTYAPLRAALEELLSIPQKFDDKLGNYVFGPDLKLRSATIKRGTATIRFSGAISVAGICDEPRITEQILGTAMQFRTVKRVNVFVGNKTLRQAIR